jgi:hypothetical protein
MRMLCARLKRITVIIMDNARYHSRKLDPPLTKSSTYGEMTAFCETNGINYPIDRATKSLKVHSFRLVSHRYLFVMFLGKG